MASDTRPLPKPPDERDPLKWVVTVQGRRGKAATCRACMQSFSEHEARVCRDSDSRAGAGRFLHLCCVPGGFHAQDEIQVPPGVDVSITSAIAAARVPAQDSIGSPMTDDTVAMDLDTQPSAVSGQGDFWSSLAWEKVFNRSISTLIDVPKSLQSAFAERKDDILVACLGLTPGSHDQLLAWRKLSLFDALILNARRGPGESQSESVARRLCLADEGQWDELWFELTGGYQVKSRPELSIEERLRAQAARVKALFLSGQPGRAIKALQERSPAMRDRERLPEVRALYPERVGGPACQGNLPADWDDEQFESLVKMIMKYLRRAPTFTAPGPLASRLEHWCLLSCVSDGLLHAAQALAQLGLGRVPQEILEIHAVGEIIPTSKPSGDDLRPILLSSICRRVAMGSISRLTRADAQAACGSLQLCGEGDGVAKGFHTMSALTRSDPQRVVLSVDIAMAHQSFSRPEGLQAISQKVPQLARPFAVWYGRDNHHFWRSSDGVANEIISSSGADQGDPIAQQAFAVPLASPVNTAMQSLQRSDPKAKAMLYADDIQMWLAPDVVPEALALLSHSLAGLGLKIKASKTKIFCPSPQCVLPPAVATYKVNSLKCLGCKLESEHDLSQPAPQFHGQPSSDPLIAAGEKVRDVARKAAALRDHGLPCHIAQSLLRFSAGSAMQHAMSTSLAPNESLVACDAVLREAWETVLGLKLSQEAWFQAQMPLREGGLAAGATQTALPRAAAAFACTWSRTSEYVAAQLGCSEEELLAQDPALAAQLHSAGESLVAAGLPAASAPWLDGVVPGRPLRQSRILRKIAGCIRKQLLSTADESKAARLRSSAGPGSSGFLLGPPEQEVVMDDDSFKLSVAFRLGGGIRYADGTSGNCCLRSREGPCRAPLNHHHATTCQCGGHIVRRHNRTSRYLCRWLNDGRAESEALLEQRTIIPEGIMDITVGSGSEQQWIDVAIVSPTSSCSRTLRSRSRVDGSAAKTEEKVKRQRYGARCSPFVIESGGRPGASARSVLMRFALHEPSLGQDIGRAWQALSSIIQAETALGAIQAYGGASALRSGRVVIFT